jgi:hypothetical protein
MCENALFFKQMLSKLAKSVNMTETRSFFQKTAEFYANVRFIDMGLK